MDEPENTVLSERSQSQKGCLMPLTLKFIETERRIVLIRNWGGGQGQMGRCYLMGSELQFCRM